MVQVLGSLIVGDVQLAATSRRWWSEPRKDVTGARARATQTRCAPAATDSWCRRPAVEASRYLSYLKVHTYEHKLLCIVSKHKA